MDSTEDLKRIEVPTLAARSQDRWHPEPTPRRTLPQRVFSAPIRPLFRPTGRLPWRQVVARYVDVAGPRVHALTNWSYRTPLGAALAYRFVPWYYLSPKTHDPLSPAQICEMEQHVTFEAMTPWHDHPMSAPTFKRIITDAGFEIVHLFDPKISPIYCTAIHRGRAGAAER